MCFGYGSWVLNFFFLNFFGGELCLHIGLSVSWLGVKCITMGYLFHVWGGVGVGFFFLVISICTELFCLGKGMTANKA